LTGKRAPAIDHDETLLTRTQHAKHSARLVQPRALAQQPDASDEQARRQIRAQGREQSLVLERKPDHAGRLRNAHTRDILGY
jgi:hypothetical protein